MNWKQFLTEKVLKECWDADKRPGGDLPNRPYDNRNDLLDLYEAIYRKRDFWQFEKVCWEALKTQSPGKTMQDILNNVTPWMFCFSGEGYEDRCRMAAEFYGWEESHD